jgi:uncharacterized protein with ParB-like and HNH nuclease domain
MAPPLFPEDETVAIIAAIDREVENVHTQSLDVSFNEILDMKRDGELNINPEYQRLFQWSEGAQSRFIESLLLEMPVPPIYVVEETDGKYTLIDGLQRISSYLHLRGQLEAPHLDPPIQLEDKLTFADCDIVTDLNGRTFDELGTALQIRLKRAFVRMEVVRKGSDAKFKYHMFKRLNTGGVLLSAQQLRNCTIRLLDSTFNDFIIRLSQKEPYRNCIESITDQQVKAAFDQELVLRFFAFKNNRDSYVHDIADFLTEYMEAVSEPDEEKRLPFNYAEEEQVFDRTFSLFEKTLKERSFCFANKSRTTITGGFSILHFEAFTLGVQERLNVIDLDNAFLMTQLAEEFTAIKLDQNFYTLTTGGGKNSKGQLVERIGFVTERMREVV